ncbi:Detected protein of confused Function [Hibiscus syriacus]|uniref:Detected protein of confused Function n=1 Tax=Hibiscus syriacus TaxID=106335 RepID=A0A6A3AHG2_HIBSY|nr:Detected protein of confused Function [Hibiscus syriacus]
MWFGDLIDIKQLLLEGQDLYIRVSASETELKKKANVKLAIILATVIAALLGFHLVVCYICRSRRKLKGEGGFGPVYKGTLANGQEIAVKRLSKSSGQGLNEFKNEVNLIAKLQNRNLVRLPGCCTQGDERMLVYEYMPNRSLDSFIFEYATDGLFSVKSDIFSFGILLLEVISGRKNRGFYHENESGNLIEHQAWRLWKEGKPLDVADDFLVETGDQS